MQITALRSGFYSVIQQSHIAVLGPCGLLYQLGCLGIAEFDPADLRAGLTPQAPYASSSPQYLWLLDVLSHFDERNRIAFVRFVTGAPWLPNGFQGLKIPLKVQQLTSRGQPCDDSYAPFAQTCFGLLKLPL
jgi:E3 ubiquitin-protein ligase TRIP12